MLNLVHAGKLLETKAIKMDEARGIVLIIILVRIITLHSSNGVAVERVRTATAGIHHVALVQLKAHLAADCLLGLIHERLNGLALRGKPEAVVDHGRIFRDERW